jgi:hypothetical protein
VQRRAADALVEEQRLELVARALAVDEDQRLRHGRRAAAASAPRRRLELVGVRAVVRARPQDAQELVDLAAAGAARDDVDALGDVAVGRELVGAADRHLDRLVREVEREVLDLAWPRGREEKRLTRVRRRHRLGDGADLGLEAHVEHAVGLVEHKQLRPVEHDRRVVDQVLQPAGRRDEDVELLGARRTHHAHGLAAAALAAVGADDAEAVGLRQLLRLRRDLLRELARRREHDDVGPKLFLLEQRGLVRDHLGDGREHEAHRLARAGLGDANHVAALEHDRPRLRLDHRRRRVAELFERRLGALAERARRLPKQRDHLGERGDGVQIHPIKLAVDINLVLTTVRHATVQARGRHRHALVGCSERRRLALLVPRAHGLARRGRRGARQDAQLWIEQSDRIQPTHPRGQRTHAWREPREAREARKHREVEGASVKDSTRLFGWFILFCASARALFRIQEGGRSHLAMTDTADRRATALKEYRQKLLQHKEVEAKVRSSKLHALRENSRAARAPAPPSRSPPISPGDRS